MRRRPIARGVGRRVDSPTMYLLVGERSFLMQYVDGQLRFTKQGGSAVRELTPKAAARF